MGIEGTINGKEQVYKNSLFPLCYCLQVPGVEELPISHVLDEYDIFVVSKCFVEQGKNIRLESIGRAHSLTPLVS